MQHTCFRLRSCHAELNQLTGIAAILTFPLDVEVVEAEERAATEDAQRQYDEGEPEGG